MLFMSCTCTPARFGASMCSFCLRVEILGSVLGPVARFVHVQCFFMSCTCTPARFGVTSCNFCLRVEFLRTFGPSARFWAWILTPAEMCGHTGTFVQATCIFCLRVEICAQFWAQFWAHSRFWDQSMRAFRTGQICRPANSISTGR